MMRMWKVIFVTGKFFIHMTKICGSNVPVCEVGI